MHKKRLFCAALIAILAPAVWTAETQAVHLRGQIVHVGFPASGKDQDTLGADQYRLGCWTPVKVELTNDDKDLFTGYIEVRQTDRDGDEIVCKQDVGVRGTRKYYIYIPAGKVENREQFAVRVFDTDGTLAQIYNQGNEEVSEIIPPRNISEIPNEAIVILNISENPIKPLDILAGNHNLVRELIVARSAPKDLPHNVAGLEMINIIVWDAVDPNQADLPQQMAMIEWAKRGGLLVLGVGRNWEMVNKSRLGKILPAKIQKSDSTQEVPELAEALFGSSEADAYLNKPLTYCQITAEMLTPDAQVIIPVQHKDNDRLFVTTRPCGRGRVILVAAELRDLFYHGKQNQNLLAQILGINTQKQGQDNQNIIIQPNLFTYVEKLIGFQITAGLYLLFAFIFVSFYILTATAGSFSLLKRKNLSQHNWSVFTLVALLASAFSLIAVQLIRGYGRQVQELTIVDARANEYEASATSYLGLKTGSHVTLDLRVPADWGRPDESEELSGNLRPLSPNPSMFETSTYSAGKQYQAIASLGELRAVPLRATLKQFEVQWNGQMSYRLNASLRRRYKSKYLHEDSWIRNNLNTDLEKCYLILCSPDISTYSPMRAANQIIAYPIGELADGEKLTINTFIQKKNEEQKDNDSQNMNSGNQDDLLQIDWTPPFLSTIHNQWLEDIVKVRQEDSPRAQDQSIKIDTKDYDNALLLLTTYDLVDQSDIRIKSREVLRSQGQRLDRSSFLNKHTALLVGFSKDPGPARLCWRKTGITSGGWKAIEPSESNVMYRIAIPIKK